MYLFASFSGYLGSFILWSPNGKRACTKTRAAKPAYGEPTSKYCVRCLPWQEQALSHSQGQEVAVHKEDLRIGPLPLPVRLVYSMEDWERWKWCWKPVHQKPRAMVPWGCGAHRTGWGGRRGISKETAEPKKSLECLQWAWGMDLHYKECYLRENFNFWGNLQI